MSQSTCLKSEACVLKNQATFSFNLDQNWLEVLSETKDITDWSILSVVLGVSDADLQRIKSDNPGQAFNQQQTIVKAWLNSGKASWASLVNALRHELVNQGGHASRIAKKHVN